MTQLPLTLAALKSELGVTTVLRGTDLWRAGHVQRAAVVANGVIEGQVLSSNRRSRYEQRIELAAARRGIEIEGDCTCPVAYNCKHVAAVLLQALDRHGPLPVGGAGHLPLGASGTGTAAADAVQPLVVSPAAAYWIDELETDLRTAAPAARKAAAPKRIVYGLGLERGRRRLTVYTVALRRDGSWGRLDLYSRGPYEVLAKPPSFADDTDCDIFARLLPLDRTALGYDIARRAGVVAVQTVAEAGRLWKETPADARAPLAWGGHRAGALHWQPTVDGGSRPACVVDGLPDALVLATDPPLWLTDEAVGVVEVGVPGAVARRWIEAPALSALDRRLLAPRLTKAAHALGGALPVPQEAAPLEEIAVAPVVCLRFHAVSVRGAIEPCLDLAIEYGPWRATAPLPEFDATSVVVGTAQGLRLVHRDAAAERAAVGRLLGVGLFPDILEVIGSPWRPAGVGSVPWRFVAEEREDWADVLANRVPRWQADGWRVEIDASFPLRMHATDGVFADLSEPGEGGWFDIGVDVQVDGQRLPLAPLLATAMERYSPAEWLRRIQAGEEIALPLDDAADVASDWVRLPAARLAPLLRVLDLWFDGGLRRGEPKARLSAFDLGALDALDELGIASRGAERLRALARDLKGLAGIAPIAPPAGLAAHLRPYQAQGLAWLDFLRAHGLAGILADDMGLGKTLQTLALLLREKEEGRLTAPALVVAPTSLVRNWQDEAARFAPALRVLAWHGLQRKARVGELGTHDVVLTSYALLPRDVKTLAGTEWHYVVLDESQRIKNARSQAAQALSLLRARHRLCLSGTPLENHLGELWSQMNFLLPGLLGDADRFRRQWRTPIEKGGDTERARLLAARVRPFMLRRSKAEVAAELPPKTETVLKVELDGAQRDLYETVRAAMDKRVRDAIARRGLAQSQVVVLDALLKMRQVCCDPLLLPEKARSGFAKAASAKRKLLAELLPELIEDGRRVLVFSSFASMLELIEDDLRAAGTPYGKLTGASTDRAQQVAEFQSGTKPVFLISLKAGGVGLNLTAADAVIVYDPWWNPAAENQAIDRAHRIGQDKPVFVYKLIAAGTVEERILDLQARKADLAARLLAGAATDLALTEADFAALFAPTGEA